MCCVMHSVFITKKPAGTACGLHIESPASHEGTMYRPWEPHRDGLVHFNSGADTKLRQSFRIRACSAAGCLFRMCYVGSHYTKSLKRIWSWVLLVAFVSGWIIPFQTSHTPHRWPLSSCGRRRCPYPSACRNTLSGCTGAGICVCSSYSGLKA